METITINGLDRKGTMLVVGIEGKKEHTMNTGWQEQLVDYIEKDVGVGGSVSVEMVDKPDKNNPNKIYHNITSVDLTSAKKGNLQVEAESNKANAKEYIKDLAEPSRDDRITAAYMVKCSKDLVIAKFDLPHMTSQEIGRAMCEMLTEVQGVNEVALNRLK